MTYEDARKLYPSVPDRILRWAVDNIPNERQVRRGLYQLEVGMGPPPDRIQAREVGAIGAR